FHRAQDVAIVERRQLARQSALNADFGRAPLLGLAALLRDFVEREEVGSLMPRPNAEGAKLAADKTNIGEVDVAGDDVADHVADQPAADFVGGNHQPEEIVAFALGERQALVAAEHATIERAEDLLNRRSDIVGHPAARVGPVRVLQRLPVAPIQTLHVLPCGPSSGTGPSLPDAPAGEPCRARAGTNNHGLYKRECAHFYRTPAPRPMRAHPRRLLLLRAWCNRMRRAGRGDPLWPSCRRHRWRPRSGPRATGVRSCRR